jgi:pSer/pThr/pTyr-binding forkhead associated (FHA) protein
VANIEDKTTAPFGDSSTNPPDGEDAFLVVNGIDLFPLRRPITSIGRRLDNALVLNDPRVSRTHAELRCYGGRFVIFDMRSTGGTYLNGKRVMHSIVYDGDVISLAGVHLIFRQRNLPKPDLNKDAMF